MTTSKDAKDAAEDLSLIRQVLDKTYYNIKSISGIFMIWLLVWVAPFAIKIVFVLPVLKYQQKFVILDPFRPSGILYVASLLVSFIVFLYYRQKKLKNQTGFCKKILDVWGVCVLLPMIFDFIMRFRYPISTQNYQAVFANLIQLYFLSFTVFSLSYGLAMLFTGILTGRKIPTVFAFIDFLFFIITLLLSAWFVNMVINQSQTVEFINTINTFSALTLSANIIIKISNLLAMFIIARRSQKKEGGIFVGNQSYSGSL